MNTEIIGKFIKKLREEKGWSQEELARKLYITRQSVSSWENGKSIPDIEKIKTLSTIFNVNIEDLYAGEKLQNSTQKNEIIYKVVKNEHKKLKRLFIISMTILLLFLFLFFIYYFINSYKSLQVYLIGSNETKIHLDGLMITSKDKTYFQLFLKDMQVKEINLYYRDKLIYRTEDDNIKFIDTYGYNEYINYDYLNDFINNLYLKICEDNEKVYNVQLILNKDFENGKLFFKKSKIVGDETTELINDDVPPKILENFNYENGNYKLSIKNDNTNIDLWYIVASKEFWVTEMQDDNLRDWQYFIWDNSIIYKEEKSGKIEYQFSNNIKNDEDIKEKEIIEYFKKNYIEKYLE